MIGRICSHRYGCFFALDNLDTVVQNGSYAGSGELAAKTIEGQDIAIPYDTFRSTVSAGDARYLVEFTVTESPSGGNAVHSVEIVKAPETQLRALYDQYMRAGAGNQSVETGGAKGYNGNGFEAEYNTDNASEKTSEEPGIEGYNELTKKIADNWNGTDTEDNTVKEVAGDAEKPFADGIIRDGNQLENGKLKPNVTYQSGGHDYIYTTNEDGLIVNARTVSLQLKTHSGRLKHNPNTYGKVEGDQAGHLFGDRFGGSPELDNLVSQAQKVNQSEFKIIENQWANALINGQQVAVDITINYAKGSARPVSFDVFYTIDGIPFYTSISN